MQQTRMNIPIKLLESLTIRERYDGELLGYCPICGCDDANFNTQKLAWRCWHCPGTGRIISEDGYVVKEVEEVKLDIPAIRKLYESFVDKCHKSLSGQPLEYLRSRGFTDDTIERFRLGFCSNEYMEEYQDPIASDSGILYKGYSILSNRITIPYTLNGEVLDVRGRIVDGFTYKDKTPKYMSLAGSYKTRGATCMFNHDVIKDSEEVIITEGEFKAILGSQYGFPVVATPGIHRWMRSWSDELKGKSIIIAADSERPVRRRPPAYFQVANMYKDFPDLGVLFLYHGMDKKYDIDSYILEYGADSFRRRIDGAMDAEYYLSVEGNKVYGKRTVRQQ